MENSAEISFMGFTRMDLESAVCFLCAVVFSLFLMVFSWQDLHRKRIRVSWLYGFGTAGMALTMIRCVLSIIKDGWDWKKSVLQITVWLLGMLPGDSFVLDGAADERCGRTGRWLLFSDHWVLSGGMADA